MRITLGKDYFEARSGRSQPIVMDTQRLINGHVIILGGSGVGKSWTIRKMIQEGAANAKKVRFHVFDVHGDLELPGASVVQFSETAPYGLNPLKVNPDPAFGGVRKAVQAFIRTVNQASVTQLGVKQESVLRSLMLDVYREFGFDDKDPGTWAINEYDSRPLSSGADNRLYLEVPIAEKDVAKALGARWDPHKRHWWIHSEKYRGDITKFPLAFKERTYPTVDDLVAYARRLHEERFLGSDQNALRALHELNRAARILQKRLLEKAKLQNREVHDKEAEEALEQARVAAIEAYESYVGSVRSGLELESLIKYDSPEVLKSVADRMVNVSATGVFKGTPPPFDPANPVWRYKLNPLLQEEKKMLVLFLLQDLFNQAVQRGEQSDVVDVAVLDELGVYVSDQDEKGDGIIGVIAREARKFGLALWAANQSPTNVPDSLISNVGTKIILGIDEMHWDSAVRKFRIEAKQLAWIQPKSTFAVQLKESGTTRTRWHWASL